MKTNVETDIIEKHYSLSALSRESGIRKKTLSYWIQNGWLIGNKVSEEFELYTKAQLSYAIIRANRALGRASKVSLQPEEMSTITLTEFTANNTNGANN